MPDKLLDIFIIITDVVNCYVNERLKEQEGTLTLNDEYFGSFFRLEPKNEVQLTNFLLKLF